VAPASGTGSPPGTVLFQRQNSGGNWVTITGCGSRPLSGGTATCDFARQTAATQVRATYQPTGSWDASQSGEVTVPAAPAGP